MFTFLSCVHLLLQLVSLHFVQYVSFNNVNMKTLKITTHPRRRHRRATQQR